MAGFVPPPYPYERLDPLRAVAAEHDGGAVDLSIGTPFDPPPAAVVEALARSGAERGYPPSVGTPAFREAAAAWMARRLGVQVDPSAVAACIGSKELVAGVPQWLRLRTPERDTVLYPAISYPTYEMGATLAGCRAVPVARRRGVAPRPRLDRRGRRGAGAVPLGQHPGQPGRRSRRPRRRGGLGPGPRRPGLLRRVLRRVHVGRTAPHGPRARHRRRRRGALALEALEPGRRPGRLLRRRRRPRALPRRGPQARRVHGPRSGPGRGDRRLGRRRARRRAASPLPRAPRPPRRRARGRGPRRVTAGRGVLPLGPGARRRRLGR